MPDIPQSGEAIIEVSKWFTIRNERDTSANEKIEQQKMAEDAIRSLWGKDVGADIDTSANYANIDFDRNFAMTNYDLSNGGDAIVQETLRRGVIMDRNFGG